MVEQESEPEELCDGVKKVVERKEEDEVEEYKDIERNKEDEIEGHEEMEVLTILFYAFMR